MADDFVCFYDNYWNCQLPIIGSDNYALLGVGIEFGPFANGDSLRDARLPDGWRKELSDRKFWFDIIDNNGRIRAKSFEDIKHSFMYPERRFSHSKEEQDNGIIFCVWDNDFPKGKDRLLVYKKRFTLPEKNKYRENYSKKIIEISKEEVCEKWLNVTFPMWNDYCAYWGEGEVMRDPQTLKMIIKGS